MKNKLLAGFSLILLFGSIAAQDLVLPALSGYKKVTNYPVFKPENLWDFINGAADTYLSYGFVDLHVAEYKKGKSVIKLEVYRHSDNTMAFGIYSTERSPSFRFIKLGAQGYSVDGAINFFKGKYYVKIRTFSKNDKVMQSAKSLAVKVSNMLDGDSEMPGVLSKFPDTGIKVNEETYINESVLGHKYLDKAYKANYQVGSDVFSVYIMEKRTAEDATESVEDYLKANGLDDVGAGSGRYMFTDGYNGTIFLSWNENMIVIISGLSKDQSELADQYTSGILK